MSIFKLDPITHDEYEKRKQESIAALTDDQKTGIFFNDEEFYFLGMGHSFIRSFFKQYITKSGVEAFEYHSFWDINRKEYNYKDGSFTEIIREPYKESKLGISDIQLPKLKLKVSPTSIADLLKPVKPKSND